MWPPSSPDCNPLDFSFWSVLASAVCDTAPKNRADLIQRIQDRWHEVLRPEFVVKTCKSAWDRLRHVVDAGGSYIEA